MGFPTSYRRTGWSRVVHGLGQHTGWVELGWVEIFYFRWVGLGHTSEMVKAQKLKFFIFREFIDIDTDGHGFDWVVGCAGSSVQVFTMV